MTNARDHAARRKLFGPPFAKSAISSREDLIREKVNLAVDKIKQDARTGNADLVKWWQFMAADTIGELSFGKSFGLLELGAVGAVRKFYTMRLTDGT